MGFSVLFLAFFGCEMKTELGVVIYMYLKHSPDYIDSKYIWVHGIKSNTIFGFFNLTQGKKKGVTRWDPAHVTARVKQYMHTKF